MAVGPEVSEEIKRWLSARGMLQADLARELGASPQVVSDWLSRASGPPPEQWPAIERVLHLEHGQLARVAGLVGEAPTAIPLGELVESVDVLLSELTRMQELLRAAIRSQQPAPPAKRSRRK